MSTLSQPAKAQEQRPTLTVIIPVCNEARTIRQVLRRVEASPVDKEILIVDDGSIDGTREFLRNLETSPRPQGASPCRVFYQERRQGKGAAVRRVVQEAKGMVTIIQDADLDYNPQEYPALIEFILNGHSDVVYGSRFRSGPRRVLFFWHALGNRLLTLLSNIFTDLDLTDVETCYKAFRTELLQSIPLRSNGFGFEAEVTAKVAKLRLRIFEVPISYEGRSYIEGKKFQLRLALQTVWAILVYWLKDDLYQENTELRALRIMEGAGRYNGWLFRQCRPFVGQRVVEIGAGIGNITKYLVDRDFVLATDLSEFYRNELRRQFGEFPDIKIETLDLASETDVQRLEGTAADTVIALNVVEHIEQDALAVRNVFRLLRPGGRFLMLVPAHAWLFSPLDAQVGHFRRYTVVQASALLSDAGFRIRHKRYLNALGVPGWWVNGRIFKRKRMPTRQVRLFDRLVPLLKYEEFWSPPFGLSALVVGEKP